MATFEAEYKYACNGGKLDPLFEVLDVQKLRYVNNLLKDTPMVKVFQDLNEEYFAVNLMTGKRTVGEKDICKISEAMINSILV